jgi:hypothetical protein
MPNVALNPNRVPRACRAAVLAGILVAAASTSTARAATPSEPSPPASSAASRLVARPSPCGDPADITRQTGVSVAMSASGSTMVVGAPAVDFLGGLSGRVYVCTLGPSGWQVTILQPSFDALPESDWGSAVAISADGRTIAVGDHLHSVPGAAVASGGLVDLYRLQSAGWTLSAELTSPKPEFYGGFGFSVALSADGSRIVVGAPTTSEPNLVPHTVNYERGAAWIFTARPGTNGWDSARLPLPSAEYVQNFGTAVAVSGDGNTAVVGSVTTGPASLSNGHVYVYDTSGPQPPLTATIRSGQLTRHWDFGASLALSADGSTVAVGAPDDAAQGVQVFNRASGSWQRTATIRPQGRAVDARFGQGIALSADGRTMLASAPSRTADGGTVLWAGGGYRFVHDGAGWHWGGELAPATPTADQSLGWSIATSADARLAVLGAAAAEGLGARATFYVQQD